MKNVTLSAEGSDIEAARARARASGTTLNEEFRRWLREYANQEAPSERMMSVIHRLQTSASTGGRRFTRDERNER